MTVCRNSIIINDADNVIKNLIMNEVVPSLVETVKTLPHMPLNLKDDVNSLIRVFTRY